MAIGITLEDVHLNDIHIINISTSANSLTAECFSLTYDLMASFLQVFTKYLRVIYEIE